MELAKRLFDARTSFHQNLMTIDEVIHQAEKNDTGKPIVLADSPDSPNAGACGDSPALIERIKALGSDVKAAFYINDSKVVDYLWDKAVGCEYDITLGATKCDRFYKPVELRVHLNSKHVGNFVSGRDGHVQNVGRVVNFTFRNADILAMDEITLPGAPQLYRHFGIEPEFYQLVNIKACTSFRANYESIAVEICETATPGVAPIDIENVNYERVPKSFWPWSDISGYAIPEPVALR